MNHLDRKQFGFYSYGKGSFHESDLVREKYNSPGDNVVVLERTSEGDGLVCRDGEGHHGRGHHVGDQEDVGQHGLINYQEAAESLQGEK